MLLIDSAVARTTDFESTADDCSAGFGEVLLPTSAGPERHRLLLAVREG